MKRLLTISLFLINLTLNAQTWNTLGIAGLTPGTADYPSLAFIGSTAHLAFSDGSHNYAASVMKYDGTNWVYVGSPGFSALKADYISLVVNGTTPYVVFQDWQYDGSASLMKYNGQSWEYVGIPGFSSSPAYYTSLAFDGTTPYVSFMDVDHSSKATVMKYNGQNWVYVGSPGFSAGKAYYTPIALYNGTPYVAYRDFANASKATVMKFDGTNWVSVGTPGFTGSEADYLSIAFYGSTPYLAFEDYAYTTKASVMKFDGNNWVYVGNPGFSAGYSCFLTLVFNGSIPYVGFWDGNNGSSATVMKLNGNYWETVGTAAFSTGKTYYNFLAINGNTPYVAYQDYQKSYKATVMKYDTPTPTYQINVSSSPSLGGIVSGGGAYVYGSQVTVIAVENQGYTFKSWTENGTIVSTSKNYIFSATSNRVLVANFQEIQDTVSVSISPLNSGTVTGAGYYNYGSSVSLTATPNSGFAFTNWSEAGNVISYNSHYIFVINKNRTLVANFTPQYLVSLSSNPAIGGSVNGQGSYNLGSLVSISAVPNTGYEFINWTENGNVISSNQTYSFSLITDRSILANFKLKQFTINLTSSPQQGGTTTGNGVYNYGVSLTVKAISNAGYSFQYWTENGVIVSPDSNYTFVVNVNKSLTANFLAPPSPPLSLAATSISSTSFKANWNASISAIGYYLDVAIDNLFSNILSSYNVKDVGNITSYIVTGLTAANTFYYRVRAYNKAGISNNSNIISATTLPNAPLAPTAKVASDLGPNSFKANWISSQGADGYYLDLSIDPNFTNILSIYNNLNVGNVTNYTLTNLTTNFTYYYRIRAFNISGTSPNSNTMSVTIITGVENNHFKTPSGFQLYQNYPNPFNPSTMITFDIPAGSFTRISIFDPIGEEIKLLLNKYLESGHYEINFDASSLRSGIYFYKIQSNGYSMVKKMILMK